MPFLNNVYYLSFFPPLLTETGSFLYPIRKDGKRNGEKKQFSFLNTNILNDLGEVLTAEKLIHLSAPPAADLLHPAGCFATSLAPVLCGTASFCQSIRRALHRKHD